MQRGLLQVDCAPQWPAARGGKFLEYGQRKQFDFFVQHLLGVTPPNWNAPTPTRTSSQP